MLLALQLERRVVLRRFVCFLVSYSSLACVTFFWTSCALGYSSSRHRPYSIFTVTLDGPGNCDSYCFVGDTSQISRRPGPREARVVGQLHVSRRWRRGQL